MGLLAADLAGQDMEEARELMRRLMWSLNDESGSSGWGAGWGTGAPIANRRQAGFWTGGIECPMSNRECPMSSDRS